MLSAQQLLAAKPPRRPVRSLRQQYDTYIMDRIEQYKNSLTRDELFRQADHARTERSIEEQFLLTEVMVETFVDEYIKRRLGVASFESWRKTYPKRRAAQRDPTHWGLDASHLAAMLAPRVEAGDRVLIVGQGAEACAYLLAAHDGIVTFLAADLATVEGAEHRFAVEALSSSFDALCVQFDRSLPPFPDAFALAVIDAGTLATLTPGARRTLLSELQQFTAPGGLHALVPDPLGTGPEGLAGHYAAWQREPLPHAGRRVRGSRARGALFMKPTADDRTTRKSSRA